MGKRKGIITGITLDLTRIPENGEFILEDLIVLEPTVTYVKRDKYNYSSEELAIINDKYSQPCTFCGETGKSTLII
jgi:hypothetical protein